MNHNSLSLHLLKSFSSWFLYRNQDLIQYILKSRFLILQRQHPDWTCRLEYYPKPCHSSWFHSYKMPLYNLILIFNFIPSCYFISVIKFITCLRYVFCSIFLIYHSLKRAKYDRLSPSRINSHTKLRIRVFPLPWWP